MPIRLPTIVLQVYQLRMRSRTGETRFWCGSITLMIWRAVYVRFWRTRPWPSGSALLVVRVMQAGLTTRRLTFREVVGSFERPHYLSRHLLGNDDSFVVADRGFPAHWGAQPGLFRTCTTARSRVATLDGGSTPPSAWPPRVVRAHRHRSNDAPRAAKRVVSKNTNVLPSPSCPKTRTEPKARILEALSKFAETSRRGTGSAIGEPEQSFPPEYPFRPASAPIRRLVPPAGTSRR